MAASWLRVSVESPSEDLNGLLAEGLLASGGSAVEEHGATIVTYLPLDDDAAEILARLREELHAILGADPPKLRAEQIADQDWLALWRAGLEPRRVGERIVVAPTWSDADSADGDLVIRIDPQMAFGTGEHASTRGVLRLLQQVAVGGQRLLDVGTGSGILAIAAALLGAQQVLAVESDEDAVTNAAENLERNGVADRVSLLCAAVDDALLRAYGGGAFDGILANVLSSVLTPLLPSFHRSLASGGWAILSGILVTEAEALREAAMGAGFAIEREDVEEQWWSVLLRRIGA